MSRGVEIRASELDETVTERIRSIAGRFDPIDVAVSVTAVASLHEGNRQTFPQHRLLQTLATILPLGETRPCPTSIAFRIVKELHAFERLKHTAETRALPADEGPPDLAIDALVDGTRTIVNPGAPGQMLRFTLAKFEPFDATLQTLLGFTSREAARTVRLLHLHINDAMEPVRETWENWVERTMDSVREGRVVAPPEEVIRSWKEAIRLDDDATNALQERGISLAYLEMVTSNWRDFGFGRPSFSRYSLVRAGDAAVMLYPGMLCDTLPNAVHWRLNEILANDKTFGQHANRIGRNFEKIVAQLFRRWSPSPPPVEREVHALGDNDLVVPLP